MMTRLRRSELAVPASNEKMIHKAAESAADLVFLDLEDAVAPADKERARELAITALNDLDWGRKVRAVRVNDAETRWAHDDVIDVVTRAGHNLDVLILPKIKAPRDVWFFETLVTQLEDKLGLSTPIGFEILIEEAEALGRAEELAGCSPRLEALILGFGDLAASLGVRYGHVANPADAYPGDPWHHARARVIAAARAHGLDAIDGPYPFIGDIDGYRTQATWASTLGASGKWAIHPSQIEPANDIFSPTEQEIAIARQMCQAQESSDGAAAAQGALVDAATTRMFGAVLDRAELIAGRAS
ncbi:HpcH/HpaI aldolase/citrate lyase family protein [Nocardia pseudovaccinii]|uniref:HpcH/HpaI aldolase/citrate lyase family protein n=1 Tax=Nocardia pseudovaccinii TaxID=189540 RepID=UPI000A6A3C25|nr:CoA ester lyase [Nocardia pseudovaccinii]